MPEDSGSGLNEALEFWKTRIIPSMDYRGLTEQTRNKLKRDFFSSSIEPTPDFVGLPPELKSSIRDLFSIKPIGALEQAGHALAGAAGEVTRTGLGTVAGVASLPSAIVGDLPQRYSQGIRDVVEPAATTVESAIVPRGTGSPEDSTAGAVGRFGAAAAILATPFTEGTRIAEGLGWAGKGAALAKRIATEATLAGGTGGAYELAKTGDPEKALKAAEWSALGGATYRGGQILISKIPSVFRPALAAVAEKVAPKVEAATEAITPEVVTTKLLGPGQFDMPSSPLGSRSLIGPGQYDMPSGQVPSGPALLGSGGETQHPLAVMLQDVAAGRPIHPNDGFEVMAAMGDTPEAAPLKGAILANIHAGDTAGTEAVLPPVPETPVSQGANWLSEVRSRMRSAGLDDATNGALISGMSPKEVSSFLTDRLGVPNPTIGKITALKAWAKQASKDMPIPTVEQAQTAITAAKASSDPTLEAVGAQVRSGEITGLPTMGRAEKARLDMASDLAPGELPPPTLIVSNGDGTFTLKYGAAAEQATRLLSPSQYKQPVDKAARLDFMKQRYGASHAASLEPNGDGSVTIAKANGEVVHAPSMEHAEQIISADPPVQYKNLVPDVPTGDAPGIEEVGAALQKLKRGAATTPESGAASVDFMSGAWIKDAAIVGYHHFTNGLKDFAAWSRQMIADIGDWIKPKLGAIWAEVQGMGKRLASEGGFVGEGMPKAKEPIDALGAKAAKEPFYSAPPNPAVPIDANPISVWKAIKAFGGRILDEPTMAEPKMVMKDGKLVPEVKVGIGWKILPQDSIWNKESLRNGVDLVNNIRMPIEDALGLVDHASKTQEKNWLVDTFHKGFTDAKGNKIPGLDLEGKAGDLKGNDYLSWLDNMNRAYRAPEYAEQAAAAGKNDVAQVILDSIPKFKAEAERIAQTFDDHDWARLDKVKDMTDFLAKDLGIGVRRDFYAPAVFKSGSFEPVNYANFFYKDGIVQPEVDFFGHHFRTFGDSLDSFGREPNLWRAMRSYINAGYRHKYLDPALKQVNKFLANDVFIEKGSNTEDFINTYLLRARGYVPRDKNAIDYSIGKFFQTITGKEPDMQAVGRLVDRLQMLSYQSGMGWVLGGPIKNLAQSTGAIAMVGGKNYAKAALDMANAQTWRRVMNVPGLISSAKEYLALHDVNLGDHAFDVLLSKVNKLGPLKMMEVTEAWNRGVAYMAGIHDISPALERGARTADALGKNVTGWSKLYAGEKQYIVNLLDAGKVEQAKTAYGKFISEAVNFNVSSTNRPGYMNSVVGKVVGQYGVFSSGYAAFLARLANQGTRADKLATLGRFAATQKALGAAYAALGMDYSQWQWFAPMGFGGGPYFQATLNGMKWIGGGPDADQAGARLKSLPGQLAPGYNAAIKFFNMTQPPSQYTFGDPRDLLGIPKLQPPKP